MFCVIYDGNCNLCSNLVQLLEKLDQGKQWQYVPMQDQSTLSMLGITSEECEFGMILIDLEQPARRWQGSAAVEEIGRQLPVGQPFIDAYRAMSGVKWMGDRLYEQVRDHRYALFGKRSQTYYSAYPLCSSETCAAPSSQEQP